VPTTNTTMKLILVSIVVGNTRHSKFTFSPDGKVDIYKVFPFLSFIPDGVTVTVG
jgi:hypothetical protein